MVRNLCKKGMHASFTKILNFPAGIYVLKASNRNTRTRCKICSKLTIKIPERRLASFNFKHISHLVIVFPLLTLSKQLPTGLMRNLKINPYHIWCLQRCRKLPFNLRIIEDFTIIKTQANG